MSFSFEQECNRVARLFTKGSGFILFPIYLMVCLAMLYISGSVMWDNYQEFGSGDLLQVIAFEDNMILYGLTLVSIWLVVSFVKDALTPKEVNDGAA